MDAMTRWGCFSAFAAVVSFTATGCVIQPNEPLIIAVVDGGVRSDHEVGTLVTDSWNAPGLEGSALGHHGTEVAEVIAMEKSAPLSSVELLDVRVLDDRGRGTVADLAAGIEWANANGAALIVVAVSTPTQSDALSEAVRSAAAAGRTIVASTANSVLEDNAFPASYPGVVAVSAVDAKGTRAPFSRQSASVSALGVEVGLPTAPRETRTGTSFATATAARFLATCGRHLRGVDAVVDHARAGGAIDDLGTPVLRCTERTRP